MVRGSNLVKGNILVRGRILVRGSILVRGGSIEKVLELGSVRFLRNSREISVGKGNMEDR